MISLEVPINISMSCLSTWSLSILPVVRVPRSSNWRVLKKEVGLDSRGTIRGKSIGLLLPCLNCPNILNCLLTIWGVYVVIEEVASVLNKAIVDSWGKWWWGNTAFSVVLLLLYSILCQNFEIEQMSFANN